MTDTKENQEQNNMQVSGLNESSNELDTSFLDEQWANLTKDWQAQPVPKTDIKRLLRQTRSRTWRAKGLFISNIIATFGLLASWLYGWLASEWDRSLVSYLGVTGVLSIVFVYYEFKIRQSVWQQISDSPDNALQNALKGYESSLNYIRLIYWSFIPIFIVVNIYLVAAAIEAEQPIAPGLIFGNVFLIICLLVTWGYGVKRKKEYQALSERVKNL